RGTSRTGAADIRKSHTGDARVQHEAEQPRFQDEKEGDQAHVSPPFKQTILGRRTSELGRGCNSSAKSRAVRSRAAEMAASVVAGGIRKAGVGLAARQVRATVR